MTTGDFKELVDKACKLTNCSDYKNPAVTKRGLHFCVSGNLEIGKTVAKIAVAVPEAFPNCSPTFFLLNQEDFILLPHVENDGFICYTHDDTLVLDIDNALGIMSECFKLAVKTLQEGVNRKDNNEFYNEYEAYWRRFKDAGLVFANISISENVEVIKFSKIAGKESLFAATDTTERISSFQRLFNAKDNPPQFFNGLYIPLKPGSEILIPRNNQELDLIDVRELIFNNVTLKNEKRIRDVLSKTKQKDLIVIDFPQPNGNHSLFAILLKGINYSVHPLLVSSIRSAVIACNVKRVDQEYMLARGGNGKIFISKKVLVIGAGSVGSAICEELIKAAVINVDIVDKESLDIDNCYRHNCGFHYVHKKKAEAIKEKLSSYYPHSIVNAYSISIEEAISKKKIIFKNYDVIIVATGNATINQFLMRFFNSEIRGKPIVFCWLDPYGIGGHCLITNIDGKGCYQCLYTNDFLNNSASFADINQAKGFVKNISGCGTVYVPYGALDANQTAILAVRKTLGVLSGHETTNALYSWKGDSEQFLSEGYSLSPRYDQSHEHLEEGKSKFYKPKCKICGVTGSCI